MALIQQSVFIYKIGMNFAVRLLLNIRLFIIKVILCILKAL
jgi:hypothetical protein